MELRLLTREEFSDRIPQLNDLFELAFKRPIQPDFLKWRYLDNPITDLFVVVAIDENKIVANYSVSPVLINNENRELKTALSMTTMTHPNYNGRGLFTSLAKLLYEEMYKKDYHLVWGFPNDNSHGIFRKKLKWETIYEIPNFSLTINNMRKKDLKNNVQVIEDHNFSTYPEFSIENNKYQVKKYKEYYKWRYLNNPINIYSHLIIQERNRVIGNIIFKYFHDTIDILELNGMNNEVKQLLMIEVINRAVVQKKVKINSWINLNDNFHIELEKMGFKNETPITYLGAKKIFIDGEQINYSNWNIQMGDSDVY